MEHGLSIRTGDVMWTASSSDALEREELHKQLLSGAPKRIKERLPAFQ